jgi:zinc/manganese transport system substrate-binding protein
MRRSLRLALPIVIASVLAATACSDDGADTATGPASSGAPTTAMSAEGCPLAEPVAVVVSVDQWGDLAEQLAGDCGDVTTIIDGSVDDPHDYEPTPADAAEFEGADLVVVNGLDYDHWAEEAVEVLDPAPAVVNGGEVVGLEEGDNPHLWYGPTYVTAITDAITAELQGLAPDASDYFSARAEELPADMQPYFQTIESITTEHPGATLVATESVFDFMAEALGMQNLTPQGYQNAAANESDPAPGDVSEFEQLLRGGTVDVLIYNSQTEGAIPEQLKGVAEAAGVPVVEVTETVPPGVGSFVEWQLGQLEALAGALA